MLIHVYWLPHLIKIVPILIKQSEYYSGFVSFYVISIWHLQSNFILRIWYVKWISSEWQLHCATTMLWKMTGNYAILIVFWCKYLKDNIWARSYQRYIVNKTSFQIKLKLLCRNCFLKRKQIASVLNIRRYKIPLNETNHITVM